MSSSTGTPTRTILTSRTTSSRSRSRTTPPAWAWAVPGNGDAVFAGLFLGCTVYRHLYHETFQGCSRALDITLGTTNTLVLISAADGRARLTGGKVGKKNLAIGLLIVTILCAFGFLVSSPSSTAQVRRSASCRKMVHASEELMKYRARTCTSPSTS